MKRFLLAVIGMGAVAIPLGAQEASQGGKGEEKLTFTDQVVVSGSKVEEKLIDSPATISVITSDTIATNPAQNFGDLLRAVPGVNVIQMSARDINLTSRQATNTLSNSQLALLDGRSIYLDFFGLILWDFVPTNPAEIKQIEVVRGPASAVWGANALTGVVNIITKSPREARGNVVSLNGGLFDRNCDHCSRDSSVPETSSFKTGTGFNFGFNMTSAQVFNDRWSYKLTAGYFDSDPFSRPTGIIPRIPDPRAPGKFVGGAPYPADKAGTLGAFANDGTKQPKFDLRVDNDRDDGSKIIAQGGYAGTQGIVHTGIGPFNIQPKSYLAYGKVNYSKGGFKANVFANFLNAKAPNLLTIDAQTGRALQLNFSTQTYDAELGYTRVVAGKHILSMGGNARRNNFDITIAPNSKDRNEFGAYFQDEFFYDKFRFSLGARVDKFGNISGAVFSPRLSAMYKPTPDQSFRVSFNKAFRAPSTINNFLDVKIIGSLVDLRGLAPFLPPVLRPAVQAPFPLVVNALGSDIPIPGKTRPRLDEESVKAFELGYTGTFGKKTTVGLAVYQNDTNNNINFTQLSPAFDPYTAQNPPPGWTQRGLPASLIFALANLPAQLGGPIVFPRTAFTYQNLGPIRDRGLEASVDHSLTNDLTGFVNYSYQRTPEVLKADASQIPYPSDEIALPAKNRFNAGLNYNGSRYLGQVSVNFTDKAFWSDVLNSPYFGFTKSYTLVNASAGVKWGKDAKYQVMLKGTNLANQVVQQHIFGDILKRSVSAELRFRY